MLSLRSQPRRHSEIVTNCSYYFIVIHESFKSLKYSIKIHRKMQAYNDIKSSNYHFIIVVKLCVETPILRKIIEKQSKFDNTKSLTIKIPNCQFSKKKNATKILSVDIPNCQFSKKKTPPRHGSQGCYVGSNLFIKIAKILFYD